MYVNLSQQNLQQPLVSPVLYQQLQLPTMIQTISLKYNAHKVMGIITQFILPEAPCSLISINLGLPQPWRHKASTKSKIQSIFLKSLSFDTDVKQQQFSWDCFCFTGDEIDLLETEFFGFVTNQGSDFNINQFVSQKCHVLFDSCKVCVQIGHQDQLTELDINLYPINQFIQYYKNFFAQILPQQLQNNDLLQLLEQRFSLNNLLLNNRAISFANEIFIDFDTVEKNFKSCIARKNQFFPGKFINSITAKQPSKFDSKAKIGCFIGSFVNQSVLQICQGAVNYQFCSAQTSDQGYITLIFAAKGVEPYKDNEQVKFQFMIEIFQFCTFDNQYSVNCAKQNYIKASSQFLLRHFTFLSQAFTGIQNLNIEPQQKQALNIRLELYRPILCNTYGGIRFTTKIIQKDTCVTFPQFKKIKLPETRFPFHLSQQVAQSQFSSFIFVKEKGILSEYDKISKISMQTIKQFQNKELVFYLENMSFQTYKNQERLPNSYLINQILPYQVLSLIFNKSNNMITKKLFKNQQLILHNLEQHRLIHTYYTEISTFQQQNFTELLSFLPDVYLSNYIGAKETTANLYDTSVKSFIHSLVQNDEENRKLITNLKKYMESRVSQNFFHFGDLLPAEIIPVLEQIGITTVTEDCQEIELSP